MAFTLLIRCCHFMPIAINGRRTFINSIRHAQSASISALAQGLRLKREQHAVCRRVNFHSMLVQVQAGQAVCAVIVAQVRWAADQRTPCNHPLPEDRTGVTLQAPDASVSTVMREELGQHFSAGADAQELGMRAKLGPVIRGRRGGGAQFKGCRTERLQQRAQGLGVVVLDAARLVQHHRAELAAIEAVQPVIVRHVDAGLDHFGAVAHLLDVHADVCAFVHGLLCHSQRRQDQHVATGSSAHAIGPGHLHPALAKAGIGEDGGAATLQRPANQIDLMREQVIAGQVWH
ncbi:MAG: hypothetical protein IT189_12405 [Microbacteriaceae bacterium]|nr:hypothetical protein [Microbacteriaceae bacterium]